jgi:acetyltransferase-like isoleucine patch superfamily enzyme
MHWYELLAAGRRAVLRRLLIARFGEFGVGASFDPLTSRVTGFERFYIGRAVFIGSYAVMSALEDVSIGDDTVIGPGFMLMTGDHMFSEPGATYRDTVEADNRPISIGRNVWIGARVTVLKGVTIGDAAILGAGAVVTRDIPSFGVAVGIPARVVSWRFEGRDRQDHEAFIDRTLRQPQPPAT